MGNEFILRIKGFQVPGSIGFMILVYSFSSVFFYIENVMTSYNTMNTFQNGLTHTNEKLHIFIDLTVNL